MLTKSTIFTLFFCLGTTLCAIFTDETMTEIGLASTESSDASEVTSDFIQNNSAIHVGVSEPPSVSSDPNTQHASKSDENVSKEMGDNSESGADMSESENKGSLKARTISRRAVPRSLKRKKKTSDKKQSLLYVKERVLQVLVPKMFYPQNFKNTEEQASKHNFEPGSNPKEDDDKFELSGIEEPQTKNLHHYHHPAETVQNSKNKSPQIGLIKICCVSNEHHPQDDRSDNHKNHNHNLGNNYIGQSRWDAVNEVGKNMMHTFSSNEENGNEYNNFKETIPALPFKADGSGKKEPYLEKFDSSVIPEKSNIEVIENKKNPENKDLNGRSGSIISVLIVENSRTVDKTISKSHNGIKDNHMAESLEEKEKILSKGILNPLKNVETIPSGLHNFEHSGSSQMEKLPKDESLFSPSESGTLESSQVIPFPKPQRSMPPREQSDRSQNIQSDSVPNKLNSRDSRTVLLLPVHYVSPHNLGFSKIFSKLWANKRNAYAMLTPNNKPHSTKLNLMLESPEMLEPTYKFPKYREIPHSRSFHESAHSLPEKLEGYSQDDDTGNVREIDIHLEKHVEPVGAEDSGDLGKKHFEEENVAGGLDDVLFPAENGNENFMTERSSNHRDHAPETENSILTASPQVSALNKSNVGISLFIQGQTQNFFFPDFPQRMKFKSKRDSSLKFIEDMLSNTVDRAKHASEPDERANLKVYPERSVLRKRNALKRSKSLRKIKLDGQKRKRESNINRKKAQEQKLTKSLPSTKQM